MHELDVIAIATGFDSLTGSFTQIDMRGIDKPEPIRELEHAARSADIFGHDGA